MKNTAHTRWSHVDKQKQYQGHGTVVWRLTSSPRTRQNPIRSPVLIQGLQKFWKNNMKNKSKQMRFSWHKHAMIIWGWLRSPLSFLFSIYLKYHFHASLPPRSESRNFLLRWQVQVQLFRTLTDTVLGTVRNPQGTQWEILRELTVRPNLLMIHQNSCHQHVFLSHPYFLLPNLKLCPSLDLVAISWICPCFKTTLLNDRVYFHNTCFLDWILVSL